MKQVWLSRYCFYWACRRCNTELSNPAQTKCGCGYNFVVAP
jgi:hypothetical protein